MMRKKKMHEVFKWKNIFSLLIVVTMLITLVACEERTVGEKSDSVTGSDEIKQHEVDFTEELVVFYEGERWSGDLLTEFIGQHPEIKIAAYPLQADEERKEDIEYYKLPDTVKRYGDPDIILINTIASLNQIGSWYQEGHIGDFATFLAEDLTLNTDEYVGGTFEVFKKQDAIMGLPLSWETRCMVIRDAYWTNQDLSVLEEDYTGKELINILNIELKKAGSENHTFWMNDAFDLSELLYQLDLIKEDNEEFAIEEEAFESAYSFAMVKRAVESYVEKTYVGNIVDSKLNPINYGIEAKHLGCSFWGAPQSTAMHAKSIAATEGQSVQLWWMPTYESSDEYIGQVRDTVLLGGNSSRQKQAYEVIRMMMDASVRTINQPEDSLHRYSPVNIESALQMLELYNDALKNNVENQELSEEEKEQIRQVIYGIQDLYFFSEQCGDIAGVTEMYSSYYDQMHLMEYEKDEYRLCYYEVMRALNPDSDKWNLSPEEVEMFVKGEK